MENYSDDRNGKNSVSGYPSYSGTLGSDYNKQLVDLIGTVPEVTERYLQETYGISIDEFLHPNAYVIEKIKAKKEEKKESSLGR